MILHTVCIKVLVMIGRGLLLHVCMYVVFSERKYVSNGRYRSNEGFIIALNTLSKVIRYVIRNSGILSNMERSVNSQIRTE